MYNGLVEHFLHDRYGYDDFLHVMVMNRVDIVRYVDDVVFARSKNRKLLALPVKMFIIFAFTDRYEGCLFNFCV